MRKNRSVITAALALVSVLASSMTYAESHRVKGHTTKKGTYVAPTRATNPDKTKLNNYSTKGNVNPVSGKKGTKDPYKTTATKKRK